VHQDRGFEIADLRDRVIKRGRKVESAALPIAGQILRAAIDRAVGLDLAGATDANEWGEV
jgi:hypothetical protein